MRRPLTHPKPKESIDFDTSPTGIIEHNHRYFYTTEQVIKKLLKFIDTTTLTSHLLSSPTLIILSTKAMNKYFKQGDHLTAIELREIVSSFPNIEIGFTSNVNQTRVLNWADYPRVKIVARETDTPLKDFLIDTQLIDMITVLDNKKDFQLTYQSPEALFLMLTDTTMLKTTDKQKKYDYETWLSDKANWIKALCGNLARTLLVYNDFFSKYDPGLNCTKEEFDAYDETIKNDDPYVWKCNDGNTLHWHIFNMIEMHVAQTDVFAPVDWKKRLEEKSQAYLNHATVFLHRLCCLAFYGALTAGILDRSNKEKKEAIKIKVFDALASMGDEPTALRSENVVTTGLFSGVDLQQKDQSASEAASLSA